MQSRLAHLGGIPLDSDFSARLASRFKQPLKKPVQILCFRIVCSGENERCSLFHQYGKGYQYGDFISFMASRAVDISCFLYNAVSLAEGVPFDHVSGSSLI